MELPAGSVRTTSRGGKEDDARDSAHLQFVLAACLAAGPVTALPVAAQMPALGPAEARALPYERSRRLAL